MNHRRRLHLLIALLLAGLLASCGSGTTTQQAAPQQGAPQATTVPYKY